MQLLSWMILGLGAGFISSRIVNKHGDGILLYMIMGVVGAILGGWLFSLLGTAGVNGLNIWSLFVAVIGAIGLLMAYHAVLRRTVSN
jgi:uncharacterized membrane protein YeaQ/YmgE (transglycosylase-associated protein family)